MILHRFCSAREFERFFAGDKLTNTFPHSPLWQYVALEWIERVVDSTAVGFTFFTGSPDEYLPLLAHVSNLECCITVDVDPDAVQVCHTRYPIGGGRSECCVEFCSKTFDRRRFRFVCRHPEVEYKNNISYERT